MEDEIMYLCECCGGEFRLESLVDDPDHGCVCSRCLDELEREEDEEEGEEFDEFAPVVFRV